MSTNDEELVRRIIDCGQYDVEHRNDYSTVMGRLRDIINALNISEVYCLDELARGRGFRGKVVDVYARTDKGEDVLIEFKLCISSASSVFQDLEEKIKGSKAIISAALSISVNPKYLILVIPHGEFDSFRRMLDTYLTRQGERFFRLDQSLLEGMFTVTTQRGRRSAYRIDGAVLGVVAL